MDPLVPHPATRESVAVIVDACIAADGEQPLSEHKVFVVDATAAGSVGCWQARGTPAVAAVAAEHRHPGGPSHWALEVAVAPPARDREEESIRLGAGLVPAGSAHTLWSWRPSQQAAARAAGYSAFRRLLRMEVRLPLDERTSAAHHRLRSFRAGEDEAAVAAVNNRAFAGHRENSAMTAADVLAKERRPWFDASGFLVAVAPGDAVAGFCWTKLIGDIGEIYVIAVDPDHQGRGLGRTLVIAALDRLHRAGATTARLWTDADNPAVDRLYLPLGFTTTLVNEEMSRVSLGP